MKRAPRLVAAAVVAALAGCASPGSSEDTAFPLPAVTPPMFSFGCGPTAGAPYVLTGDPRAMPPVWTEVEGGRIRIRWPPGYLAVFDPELRIVRADGVVVAHAGDRLDGADGPPGLFLCDRSSEVWMLSREQP